MLVENYNFAIDFWDIIVHNIYKENEDINEFKNLTRTR